VLEQPVHVVFGSFPERCEFDIAATRAAREHVKYKISYNGVPERQSLVIKRRCETVQVMRADRHLTCNAKSDAGGMDGIVYQGAVAADILMKLILEGDERII
jgi:hypothetical protein